MSFTKEILLQKEVFPQTLKKICTFAKKFKNSFPYSNSTPKYPNPSPYVFRLLAPSPNFMAQFKYYFSTYTQFYLVVSFLQVFWPGLLIQLKININPLNAELNPICHLLALVGAQHILHVSRVRVKYKYKTSVRR